MFIQASLIHVFICKSLGSEQLHISFYHSSYNIKTNQKGHSMRLFYKEQEESTSHIPTGTYRQRLYEESRQKQTEQEPSCNSIGGRFILCILLLCGYLFLASDIKQDVKNYVRPDYSKNVFDFITELSYTLDYEEISAK